jgi:hypothetical protein
MSESQDLIEQILNIEWQMFSRVKSATPAACQRAPDRFQKIRGSNYEMWTKEMLESYLHDLKMAQEAGRNLVTEKYARMDNLIPPLNTNPLLSKIVEIETKWQKEIMKKFPAVYDRLCRNTSQVQNGSNFSIYLKSELETYSDRTIQLYYEHVKKAVDKGRNIALDALKKLIKKAGYRDLDHAENYLKK